MQILLKHRPLYLTGGVLLILLVSITVVVAKFGNAYRRGLLNVTNQKPTQELALREKKIIRRLSVRKSGEAGCLEITPDGAVRVYSRCGSELETASRLTDIKNIVKLFKLISENDLAATLPVTPDGEVYELTIVTENGSQVVYIVFNPDNSGTTGEIINTIEDIKEDIPQPSPTPTPAPIESGPTPTGVLTSPTPTGGFAPTPLPTTSPAPQAQQPFLCDFAEGGGQQRPLTISNTICSTAPTPAP